MMISGAGRAKNIFFCTAPFLMFSTTIMGTQKIFEKFFVRFSLLENSYYNIVGKYKTKQKMTGENMGRASCRKGK